MTPPPDGRRRRRWRRGRRDALAAACRAGLVAVGVVAASPAAQGAPTTIGVIAPRGSRLADDLRREIEASRFVVVAIDARAPDWRADAGLLPGPALLHGVVVRADEQQMTIFTRAAPSGAVTAHIEQAVEADDRLARRRACLSVVEYLRVLAEGDRAPSVDLGAPGGGPRTTPGSGRVGSPSSFELASARGAPLGDHASSAHARAGLAASAGRPVAGFSSRNGNGPTETAVMSVPELAPPPDARAPWSLGVGTTLDFESAPGGPMGHLQLLWLMPIESRVALSARALWPLLGAHLQNKGDDIRSWTMGGSVGIRYQLREAPARLRPFVGAMLGTRVALTETTSMASPGGQTTLTPSVNLGVEAGLVLVLGRGVQVFFAVEGARDWMVPGAKSRDYAAESANAESFHAAAGALFEF